MYAYNTTEKKLLYHYKHTFQRMAAVPGNYKALRIRQLDQTLKSLLAARSLPRPVHGWLKTVREALGLTLDTVGKRTRNSRSDVRAFERAEVRDRITLRSLRKVADAMGCELVYAIVPRSSSTFAQLAEAPIRDEARKGVLAVEHSMALEGQAAGRVAEKVKEETRRILKKRK
jgi:predicted DNA-binding mobile mystery protein A